MERNNCVYFLRDPRDSSIRYIGVSKQPHKRFVEHWSSKGTNYMRSDRTAWFRELDDLGLKPVLQVAFSGLTRKQALQCESVLILRWNNRNPGQLLQHTVSTLVYTNQSDVSTRIEKLLGTCSPSCRRAVIEHFSQLVSA